MVLSGNRRDICKSNRDLVMKGETNMKRKLIVTSNDGKSKVEYDMENVQGIRIGKAVEEYGKEYCEAGFEEDKWKKEVVEKEDEEKPEKDLKEIWKQVEEKAMEKLNRVYKAVEDRDKEALDETHKEYFDYLTKLSMATGLELIQLDNHFGNLYWMKK